MEVKLTRKFSGPSYTIGQLTINGIVICDTLERPAKGSVVRIPAGKYLVTNYPSAKFKDMRPIINNVPGRSGILIHEGNTVKDTTGCILVGDNTTVGMVTNSRRWLSILQLFFKMAWDRNEQVYITIA